MDVPSCRPRGVLVCTGSLKPLMTPFVQVPNYLVIFFLRVLNIERAPLSAVVSWAFLLIAGIESSSPLVGPGCRKTT